MRIINEIRKQKNPYKVICIELGGMGYKYRLRIGFIFSHKKSKLINYHHRIGYCDNYQIGVKNFSVALLIKPLLKKT